MEVSIDGIRRMMVEDLSHSGHSSTATVELGSWVIQPLINSPCSHAGHGLQGTNFKR